MFEKIKAGTKGVYTNSISGITARFETTRDVSLTANVIPINIFNDHGDIEYANAWVSKENLTFDKTED